MIEAALYSTYNTYKTFNTIVFNKAAPELFKEISYLSWPREPIKSIAKQPHPTQPHKGENKMANQLTDLKLWLWNNTEGLHVTCVTNYGTPWEKRSFFSFSGNNTLQGFKAYRDKQPTALKDYFAEKRKILSATRDWALENGFDCRVSKLVENTGTGGRRVLNGCMLLMSKPKSHMFVAFLGDEKHDGEFSPDLLSGRQLHMPNAVGAYFWKQPSEAEDDYGSAF